VALPEALSSRLKKAAEEFDAVSKELGDPAVLARPADLKRLSQALGLVEPLAAVWRAVEVLEQERKHLREMAEGSDAELAALAKQDLEGLRGREEALERRAAALVEEANRDPDDQRGAVLEIRAGTGGEEASLFASEILRMYLRFAERRGWKAETVELSRTALGGVREAVITVEGDAVWKHLKFEGGVHRVQRVPVTEASGRIHTSAVSVVALPEVEEVEVGVNPSDLRIDTFCSSGPGGQSVNTTYSAVRIVHVPTGVTVQCQDERSQQKNKARAMKVLVARLKAVEEEKRNSAASKVRREQVRTGDRSEKIRTYNFPQNRVTDHRAGFTLHRLQDVLDGNLDELLSALAAASAAGKMGKAADTNGDDD